MKYLKAKMEKETGVIQQQITMKAVSLLLFLISAGFACADTDYGSFETSANKLLKQTEEYANYRELNDKYDRYYDYLKETLAKLEQSLAENADYQQDKVIWQKSFDQSKKTIQSFKKNNGRQGQFEAYAAEAQLLRQRIEFLYSLR